jgi:hypothetical protein
MGKINIFLSDLFCRFGSGQGTSGLNPSAAIVYQPAADVFAANE